MSVALWTTVRLGDVLTPNTDVVDIDPLGRYQQVTIKLWGRGVVPRGEINGADIKGTARTRVRAGQFIVSKIDARNGAMGVVPTELDGALASNDFPSFDVDSDRLRPACLAWLCKTPSFVELCKRASEGTTNRVRLSQERLLGLAVTVPSIDEQDRIVAVLDSAAARVKDAKQLCEQIDGETEALLRSVFHQLSDPAPRQLMSEVAPLHRRQVEVSVLETYPQVSVRSFGKGTFHREPLAGAEITWEQPYLVHGGDVLLSNIKAWEGAVAVAQPEDHGRFGSHRYLTCVVREGAATPGWVVFYLLTREGLDHLGKASPGSADRNRTLGTKALMGIPVPTPPYQQQVWFDGVQKKVRDARAEVGRIVAEAEALIPAILDRAFKGDLSASVGTASTSCVSALMAPVISTRVDPHADSVPTHTAAPTRAIAEKSAQTVVPGPSGTGSTVHIWNIPEIAAIQAELVRRNGGSATLGRKKISKGAYLAAALLSAKQNPPPLRKAAGPFNTQGQNEVEAYATQAGWFRDSGLASGQRSASRYRAGDRITEAAAKAKGLVAARAADFERFVGLFVNWDSDTAELHATAHAAWNGLIAAAKPVTEAAIIETFFEWSEEKAKFKATQIRSALATLRSLGMEPDGGGPVVLGVGESNLFSGASR